jgi:ferric-dicitrate binding protein FerR (iron transport regulator)
MLGEEAQEYYRTAKERLVSISFFRPTPLAEIVARIAEFTETSIATDKLPPAIANRKLTLAVDKASLQDVLEALVVPLGAAVRPEAGKLVLAARR